MYKADVGAWDVFMNKTKIAALLVFTSRVMNQKAIRLANYNVGKSYGIRGEGIKGIHNMDCGVREWDANLNGLEEAFEKVTFQQKVEGDVVSGLLFI